jgi:hypothetical protein
VRGFRRALGGFKDYKLVSLVEFVWCFDLRKERFFCVVFQVEILREGMFERGGGFQSYVVSE